MSFSAQQFGDFAPDHGLEVEGVWIKVGEPRFLIRRSGGANVHYDRAVAKYSKKYRKELQRGTMDNDVADREIIQPAFIETVLLDWQDVRDNQGADVPFSRAAAKDLFETFPDVYDTLRDYAGELSTFRRRDVEETADQLGES